MTTSMSVTIPATGPAKSMRANAPLRTTVVAVPAPDVLNLKFAAKLSPTAMPPGDARVAAQKEAFSRRLGGFAMGNFGTLGVVAGGIGLGAALGAASVAGVALGSVAGLVLFAGGAWLCEKAGREITLDRSPKQGLGDRALNTGIGLLGGAVGWVLVVSCGLLVVPFVRMLEDLSVQ